jgi:hypothetical protein
LRLHTAIEPGERLRAVTDHRTAGGPIYYALAAMLTVTAKTFNPPGYQVWGAPHLGRHAALGVLRRT